MRYKNIEFRRPEIKDSNGYIIDKDLRYPEIVAWFKSTRDDVKEYCYTLCWLKEGKDEWYIETIGNRFTENDDLEAVMHVAKYALRILNTEKKFYERNNES